MTLTEKKDLINQITSLLDRLIDVDAKSPCAPAEPPIDKPHVRAGAGRNGKILVSKVSLLKYLGIAG